MPSIFNLFLAITFSPYNLPLTNDPSVSFTSRATFSVHLALATLLVSLQRDNKFHHIPTCTVIPGLLPETFRTLRQTDTHELHYTLSSAAAFFCMRHREMHSKAGTLSSFCAVKACSLQDWPPSKLSSFFFKYTFCRKSCLASHSRVTAKKSTAFQKVHYSLLFLYDTCFSSPEPLNTRASFCKKSRATVLFWARNSTQCRPKQAACAQFQSPNTFFIYCAIENPHSIQPSLILPLHIFRAALSDTSVTAASSILLITCTPQPLVVLHSALKLASSSKLRLVRRRHLRAHRFPPQQLLSRQLWRLQEMNLRHLVHRKHTSRKSPAHFSFRALTRLLSSGIARSTSYHFVGAGENTA